MLRIHDLLDDNTIVFAAAVDRANVASLTLAEAAVVAGAVEKRRNEFATGRAVAHAALAQLGRTAEEILSGKDRAPIWPRGVCGSISHSHSLAVAAVTGSPRVGSVGIDIEHPRTLDRDIWRLVFLPAEIDQLKRTPDFQSRNLTAVTLFSAKEAFYTAQYPQTGRFLDFHAVHVELVPSPGAEGSGELWCTFQTTVGPFAIGTRVHGHYSCDSCDGGILTAVTMAWR
jgi:4'-phosphopantetheinyl transferase EntD